MLAIVVTKLLGDADMSGKSRQYDLVGISIDPPRYFYPKSAHIACQ